MVTTVVGRDHEVLGLKEWVMEPVNYKACCPAQVRVNCLEKLS
jgi:hypothetical protein